MKSVSMGVFHVVPMNNTYVNNGLVFKHRITYYCIKADSDLKF